MRKITIVAAVAVFGLVLVTGCRTVVNPFTHLKPDYSELPVDALRAAALQIEQAVRAGEREAALTDQPGLVLNEAVRQAVRTRAARSAMLYTFLDTGFGCELRNGLVEVVRGKDYKGATDSRQRDRDALLVMHENEDRWNIYEGILDANGLAPRALSAIQETFYQCRIELLTPGQKYEDASGERLTK